MKSTTMIGLGLGALTILVGQKLFQGSFGALFHLSGVVIVFLGTLSATIASYPAESLKAAKERLSKVFSPKKIEFKSTIQEITTASQFLRKEGLVALEEYHHQVKHPYFKKGMKYLYDGYEKDALSEMMDLETDLDLKKEEECAEVFDKAANYAPVMGVLGGILGLTQALSQLENSEMLVSLMSSAFMTTLYGLAFGNFVLAPISEQIRIQAKEKVRESEMIRLGIVGIKEGLSPQLLQEKLVILENDPNKQAATWVKA